MAPERQIAGASAVAVSMIAWHPGNLEALLIHVLAATLSVWVALSAYVIASRVQFDRRARRLAELERYLASADLSATVRHPRSPDIERILAGLSRRHLYRLMAHVDFPRPMVDLFAAHALERWGVKRLVRDASRYEGRRPWRRISALFALGALRIDGVHGMLRDALFDSDPDVAAAAVVILRRLEDEQAAAILVEGIAAGAYSASRIATQLDKYGMPIDHLLIPLLEDPRPSVRYWAVSLLARYPGPEIAQRVAKLADDPDAPVRKAALQSLAATHPSHATDIAVVHLTDPVAFVRSAAIRSLGAAGLADASPDRRHRIATLIAPLLGDREWDVRLAAKETLVALGPVIWREVSLHLDSTDRFARNGAAEVLQNVGLLDQLIDEVGRGIEPSTDVVGVVERAFREGGVGMIDAAAERSNHTLFPSVATLLSHLSIAGVRITP